MIKKNLIANYLGQGWVAVMGFAFIPVYIKYLGIEAYGLIGLFAILQAWLNLLDMGMGPALNREMARFTGGTHGATSIRDLLRSIEFIALPVAFLLALGTWAASSWLASNWVRAEKLPENMVAQAFAIMGLVAALRLVEGIYRSSVVGLQQQVPYNLVNSALATLRGLGAIGILIWWSPTIDAFFIWQGLVSVLTLFALASVTYRALPKGERPGRFSTSALRGVGKYAGGVMTINFLGVLLTQVDKIILSTLLTLTDYGYYTLATVVAGMLFMLISPITQAWGPRLSELHAANNHLELVNKFHQGTQLVAVLMGSVAVVLVLFSDVILQLWTRDASLAQRSAHLLSILALGTMLNGLMWIPYQAQFAHGWTSLALWVNLISVIVIVPATYWAVPRYGPEGAAWIWVSLNIGYVFISMHFMFHRIFTDQKWRWYAKGLLQPLAAATLLAAAAACAMPPSLTTTGRLLWLLLAISLTLTAAAISAPEVRRPLLLQTANLFKSINGTTRP